MNTQTKVELNNIFDFVINPGIMSVITSESDDLLNTYTSELMNIYSNKDTTLLYYTGGKSNKDIGIDLLASFSNLDLYKIQEGRLNPTEWSIFSAAAMRAANSKIYINDNLNINFNIISNDINDLIKNSSNIIILLNLANSTHANKNLLFSSLAELKVLVKSKNISIVLFYNLLNIN